MRVCIELLRYAERSSHGRGLHCTFTGAAAPWTMARARHLGLFWACSAQRTHALTKNADCLALRVLRAFVVIAAPAGVCNAVDLGHHPLTFCHCVWTRMFARACVHACVRVCVRAEQPHARESRTSKQWLMSAACALRCMCMCARTVTRLLGCGINVELIDSRHKLMSQRMAQRAALVPAIAHR